MNPIRLLGAVILGCFVLAAGIRCAQAETVTLVHPTTRTNGAALPLSEIAGTLVEWQSCTGTWSGAATGSYQNQGTATTFTVTAGLTGMSCWRAYTLDTAGGKGAASAVFVKLPARPSAPTGLTVQ